MGAFSTESTGSTFEGGGDVDGIAARWLPRPICRWNIRVEEDLVERDLDRLSGNAELVVRETGGDVALVVCHGCR